MPREQDEYYQVGYDSFTTHKSSNWACPSQPQDYEQWLSKTPDDRGQWQQGRKKAILDFVRPYATQFLQELHELELRHSASICTGCGCCGAGFYIIVDGIQYEIDEEDFTKETQND